MKFFILILVLIAECELLPQSDKYIGLREKMVKAQIVNRGVTDKATLNAMRKVPRHLFIPPDLVDKAYDDTPVPIGHGQTISQPYIVAYMTEMAKPDNKKKVLEIGTGSGYQAAVLAEIVDSVYTIEIIPELAESAASIFRKLDYKNIISKYGDGYNGWPEHAPYDIIIVTAAPEQIPQPLLDQLAEDGRMIIPLGNEMSVQELKLITKKNGKIETRRLSFVRFVPFLRSE